MTSHPSHLSKWLAAAALLTCAVFAHGCSIVGTAAQMAQDNDTPAPQKYLGMQNQVAAVMVYVDFTARTDFDKLRTEVAASLERKLKFDVKKAPDELKGLSFPYPAKSVMDFQDAHPEINGQPATDAALRLRNIPGLSRLIYVEVIQFGTRFENSPNLYTGSAVADIKVIEIANGQAKTVFQDDRISVRFPKGGQPMAGDDQITDQTIELKTVEMLTDELARRFY